MKFLPSLARTRTHAYTRVHAFLKALKALKLYLYGFICTRGEIFKKTTFKKNKKYKKSLFSDKYGNLLSDKYNNLRRNKKSCER